MNRNSDQSSDTKTGVRRKAVIVLKGLRPYALRHSRLLGAGSLAAVVTVAARLALPWPLRLLADEWLQVGGDGASVPLLPAGADPALFFGLVFLGLLAIFGLADLLERLYFARFAIAAVRDLRADSLDAAITLDQHGVESREGDLIACLVGDAARVKTGLKGFLVHVATNSLMLVGMAVVICVLNLQLGLVLLAAVALTLLIATWGAAALFRITLKYRIKEGKLADTIQLALRQGKPLGKFSDVNRSSGRAEAAITRIQGITTWCTYIVFGAAVVIALLIGSRAVRAGDLAVGDMVIFMMYILMMRGSMARVARQGSRSGKILGSAYRLVNLCRKARRVRRRAKKMENAAPLTSGLCLDSVGVDATNTNRTHAALRDISLEVRPGQRIAIIGDPGAGKTTLLEIMAGRRSCTQGTVNWDGTPMETLRPSSLARTIAFVPQSPGWGRRRIRRLVPEHCTNGSAAKTLGSVSHVLDAIIKRQPDGLDTRAEAEELSPGERRLLAVLESTTRDASLYLLDDPTLGLSTDAARDLIEFLTTMQTDAAVVLAMSAPQALDRFDHVFWLEAGRLISDQDTTVLSQELREE